MSTISNKLQQCDWGPYYLVPSKAIQNYSGFVLLRTSFDRDLLREYLDERGFSGRVVRVTNFWFHRKKGSEIWTKIGESCDISRNFSVRWDTTRLENGQYEIIGFMQAFVTNDYLIKRELVTLGNGEYCKFGYKPILVKKHLEKRVIAEQKIVEVTVENKLEYTLGVVVVYEGYEEIKKAVDEIANSDKEYYALLVEFVDIKNEGGGEPIPKRVLDLAGREELNQAENRKKQSQLHLNDLIHRYFPLRNLLPREN